MVIITGASSGIGDSKQLVQLAKDRFGGVDVIRHIITTSSVAGLKAYPNGAVYGATKWAVRDLMGRP